MSLRWKDADPHECDWAAWRAGIPQICGFRINRKGWLAVDLWVKEEHGDWSKYGRFWTLGGAQAAAERYLARLR
jgi:hypothetical protein